MTLQKSSANKQAARYDFKRAITNLSFPFTVSFLLALYIFVYSPISLFSTYNYSNDLKAAIENIRADIVISLTGNDLHLLIGIIAAAAGVLFSFCSFLFMMKKNRVNFYFSNSVDRRTMFKNRVSASLLAMAVSAAVPIIIDVIINIFCVGRPLYVIYHAFFVFLEYFTYMLVGFSLMSISMMLCSTIVESLLFGAGIIWLPSAAAFSFFAMCSTFLRGFSDDSFSDTVLTSTSIINPLFFGKGLNEASLSNNIFTFCTRSVNDSGMYYTFSMQGEKWLTADYIAPIIIWLVLCCAFIFIARQILLKRKAENAGIHGTTPIADTVFAVEISVLASSIVAYLLGDDSLYTSIGKTPAFIVALIALALIYFISISIAKRKIKHDKKSLAGLLSTVGVICVVFIVLSTGGLGYTERVPDIDDIAYATLSSTALYATGNETGTDYYDENQNDLATVFSDGGTHKISCVLSEEEDFEKLIAIHKKLAESTGDKNGNYASVDYVLKDGSHFIRTYYINDETASFESYAIRDTNAFKKELTYLMSSEEKDSDTESDLKKYISKIENDDLSYASEWSFFGSLDEATAKELFHENSAILTDADSVTEYEIENTDELTDALLTDLLSSSYEDRYKSDEKPIGIITFCNISSTEISAYYADTDEQIYDGTVYGKISYYLYESMTNTVNYLKSSGDYDLLKGDNLLEKYSVNKAYVMKCSDFRELEYGSYSRYMTYIFCQKNSFDSQDELYDTSYGNSEVINLFEENGTEITDSDELKTLDEKSLIYRYASSDDYIVLFIGENGGRYIRLITAEEAPDFAK